MLELKIQVVRILADFGHKVACKFRFSDERKVETNGVEFPIHVALLTCVWVFDSIVSHFTV